MSQAAISTGNSNSNIPKSNHEFTPFWPVKETKKAGVHFYHETIEEYISTTEMIVKGHGKMIMFGGYSYLSLHRHEKIEEAINIAAARYGSGGHGTRILAGTTSHHRKLERKISQFKNAEDAVTYSSGFMTNVSCITALVGKNDTIINDELNHKSIIDGCKLSGAKVRKFKHNDMNHFEQLIKQNNQGRVLVIADGVFSMDGDIIDLPRLSHLCKKHNALLMIDESHSLGIIGKTGRGVEEHFNLTQDSVDIKMGTFSKTIPSQGGYIAGSKKLCDFLRYQSSGFMYSGANSPINDAASIAAIDIICEEPERVTQLHQNTAYAKAKLTAAGFNLLKSQTAILPILCGNSWDAFRMATACQKQGIYIQAIPYPVVPKGQARLRLSINTDHTKDQMDHLVKVLCEAKKATN